MFGCKSQVGQKLSNAAITELEVPNPDLSVLVDFK